MTSDSALRRKLTRQRCEDSCSPVISDRQKRPGSARGFPWPKEAKTPHVPLKFSPNDEYEKVSCTGSEKSNHRLYQTMTTHERVRTRAGGWARASAHTVKPTFQYCACTHTSTTTFKSTKNLQNHTRVTKNAHRRITKSLLSDKID